MISEMKIDESFPISQFLVDGFPSPYHLDRNEHRGGILVYFKNKLQQNHNKPKTCLLEFLLK